MRDAPQGRGGVRHHRPRTGHFRYCQQRGRAQQQGARVDPGRLARDEGAYPAQAGRQGRGCRVCGVLFSLVLPFSLVWCCQGGHGVIVKSSCFGKVSDRGVTYSHIAYRNGGQYSFFTDALIA